MTDYEILALVPVLVVIILAAATRSSFEPLIAGILVGCLIVDPGEFLSRFIHYLLAALTDADNAWVIVVCMLYGSLIGMVLKGGGMAGFANLLLRHVHTRKSALVSVWILGILIFLDDYLHSLALGAAMKKVTDKFRISREMMTYIAHATSEPLCILLPISTWAIYVSGLIEKEGLVPDGQGLWGYMHAIPFMTFGYVGIALALLTALGIVPALRKMRTAEEKSAAGSEVPYNEDVSFTKSKSSYFIVPIVVLILAMVYFDFDSLKALLITNLFLFVYLFADKSLPARQITEAMFEGFRTILFPIILLILAFTLKLVNDDLRLVQYVIANLQPLLNHQLFPALSFLALAIIGFLTGTSWQLYAIALPIMIPLGASLQVNPWITVASVVCAGAFGSNAGFFSDSTILSAASSQISPMQHAITQFPYTLLALTVSILLFLIVGLAF